MTREKKLIKGSTERRLLKEGNKCSKWEDVNKCIARILNEQITLHAICVEAHVKLRKKLYVP